MGTSFPEPIEDVEVIVAQQTSYQQATLQDPDSAALIGT